MCDKAILENGGLLQKTCWWNVHALGFVPDYYKTQETCRKAVRTSPSTIHFVPE